MKQLNKILFQKKFSKERLFAVKEELIKLIIDEEQRINFEAIDIGENFNETNRAFQRVSLENFLNKYFRIN